MYGILFFGSRGKKKGRGLVQGLRRFPGVQSLAIVSGKDKDFNMDYALNESF